MLLRRLLVHRRRPREQTHKRIAFILDVSNAVPKTRYLSTNRLRTFSLTIALAPISLGPIPALPVLVLVLVSRPVVA